MRDTLTEGTLYIQATDHQWSISFVPNTPGAHGSTGTHPVDGEEELVDFLRQLGISHERIQWALTQLRVHSTV